MTIWIRWTRLSDGRWTFPGHFNKVYWCVENQLHVFKIALAELIAMKSLEELNNTGNIKEIFLLIYSFKKHVFQSIGPLHYGVEMGQVA